MKKKFVLLISTLALLFAITSILPKYCFSQETFDLLQPTLTEGGYRLELDATNPYKGVKIEVNSNVATRYEITQTIVQPIENKDNPGIFVRENFVVRSLRESQKGKLYIQSTDVPVSSVELIYTSNTTGDADNFTLVYGITGMEDIEPGHYYGRIRFTLKPISSTREQVTKFLDVYITVSEKEKAKPIVEIGTPTGSRTIYLNSRKEEKQIADVIVKINGDFKNQFNINQLLIKPLISSEGNQLDYEAVNVETQGVERGKGIPQQPLSSQPQVLYKSEPNGQADNEFVITYSLGDLSNHMAGRYRSTLQYYLEELFKPTALGTLELEVENERIFDLIITPEEQKSRIEFINLKPEEGPKKSEIIIQIKTNIGKPYQISQNVFSELTNKEGDVIPFQYFKLYMENIDTKGKLKFLDKQEVKKGDTVLFISDNKGSSDKFKIIYELTSPVDLRAGDYSTRITYSILEI